jgi:hypothetical protein
MSMAKVLITMMGRSSWGLFNSAWAAIRSFNYVPDKVVLLTGGCDRNDAEVAAEMLRILYSEHGSRADVGIRVIPEDDIREIASIVRAITDEERKAKNSVSIDVTPGKKAAALGAVLSGLAKNSFDHIFYLYIESLKNADRPYLEIPLSIQHSHDILKEAAPRTEEVPARS